jgi:hypothetical protein
MLAFIRQERTIDGAYDLAQRFGTMVRGRQQDQLDPWLEACLSSGIPDLRTFAEGLQREYSAIKAALTYSYDRSSGAGWASDKERQQASKERLSERVIAGILESGEKPAILLLDRDHGLYREGPTRWVLMTSLDHCSHAMDKGDIGCQKPHGRGLTSQPRSLHKALKKWSMNLCNGGAPLGVRAVEGNVISIFSEGCGECVGIAPSLVELLTKGTNGCLISRFPIQIGNRVHTVWISFRCFCSSHLQQYESLSHWPVKSAYAILSLGKDDTYYTNIIPSNYLGK